MVQSSKKKKKKKTNKKQANNNKSNKPSASASSSKKQKPTQKQKPKPKKRPTRLRRSRFVYNEDNPGEVGPFGDNDRCLFDLELLAGVRQLEAVDPHLVLWEITSVPQVSILFESNPELCRQLAGFSSKVHRIAFVANTSERYNASNEEGGQHWVVVLIDVKKRYVLVVDALEADDDIVNNDNGNGNGGEGSESSTEYTSEVAAQFATLLEAQVEPLILSSNNKNIRNNPEFVVDERALGVQKDDWNCGVWVLEILAEFARSQSLDAIQTAAFVKLPIEERRARWSAMLHPKGPRRVASSSAAAAAAAAGGRGGGGAARTSAAAISVGRTSSLQGAAAAAAASRPSTSASANARNAQYERNMAQALANSAANALHAAGSRA